MAGTSPIASSLAALARKGWARERPSFSLGKDMRSLTHCLGVSVLLHLLACLVLADMPGVQGSGPVGSLLPLQARLVKPGDGQPPVPTPSVLEKPVPVAIEESPRSPTRQTAEPAAVSNLPPVRNGAFQGPWYFSARYLHRRPSMLRAIVPPYPEEASQISGRVIIVLFINEKGEVDRYQIAAAEPERLFEQVVIDTFVGEKYSPGMIAGESVKSQLAIEVTFEPGRGVQSIVAPPNPGR